MNCRRAFSVIELLVVVVILLILTGLIFPVYKRSIGSARRAAVTQQERQIYLSLRMYLDDYDGKLMRISGRPGQDWPTLVEPYIGDIELLKNPDFKFKNIYPVELGRGFSINSCFSEPAIVQTHNPIFLFESAPVIQGSTIFDMTRSDKFDKTYDEMNVGFKPIGDRWLADNRDGGSAVIFLEGNARFLFFKHVSSRVSGSCVAESAENPLFEALIK